MDRAETIDKLLRKVMQDICGEVNVYFQPPANIRMKYPAIVYKRDEIRNEQADNLTYFQYVIYQVTVIDSNPDSLLVFAISALPKCRFERHFVSDGLNHDVFTIF